MNELLYCKQVFHDFLYNLFLYIVCLTNTSCTKNSPIMFESLSIIYEKLS